MYTNYSNELYHYGVLGMKWGVRRYQNADGTLTQAGKERYNREKASLYTYAKGLEGDIEEAKSFGDDTSWAESELKKVNAQLNLDVMDYSVDDWVAKDAIYVKAGAMLVGGTALTVGALYAKSKIKKTLGL